MNGGMPAGVGRVDSLAFGEPMTIPTFLALMFLSGPPAPSEAPKAPATTTAAAPVAKKAAPAKASELDQLTAKVQKAYEAAKDLSASFEQRTTFKGGAGQGPLSKGTLQLKKPGKLRWEFETPEKKSFISDGKTMWIYEPEENQVIVNEFHQETASMTALNFLEGLGQLGDAFTVTMAERPATATAKGDHGFVTLTPKDEGDVQFAKIVLAVNRKSGLADEVYLTDALGNETRITFSGIAVNKAVPDAAFAFDIPKNAEVIRPNLLQ